MRVKILTVTLLSQLALSTVSTPLWAAPVVVKSMPSLTDADKAFLNQKITFQFDFPTDAKDRIINEAASFLNQEKFSKSMTYQDLLEDLSKEDNYLSADNGNNLTPLIPGAFLDAASALYREAADEILTTDFEIGTDKERKDRVAQEKNNFLRFADILEKEARNIGENKVPVAQSISNLKRKLDDAQKSGKVYEKIYVYSDDLQYKDDYQRLVDNYPGVELVFIIFPEDINYFFTESESIRDGLVYIDRIPDNYRPFYDPIWYPFYSRFLDNDRFYLGFGYPHNVWRYWDDYYGRSGSKYWGDWKHENWRSHRFGDKGWHDNWRENRRLPRNQQKKEAIIPRDGRQRGQFLNQEMGKHSGIVNSKAMNRKTERRVDHKDRNEERLADRKTMQHEAKQRADHKAMERKAERRADHKDRNEERRVDRKTMQHEAEQRADRKDRNEERRVDRKTMQHEVEQRADRKDRNEERRVDRKDRNEERRVDRKAMGPKVERHADSEAVKADRGTMDPKVEQRPDRKAMQHEAQQRDDHKSMERKTERRAGREAVKADRKAMDSKPERRADSEAVKTDRGTIDSKVKQHPAPRVEQRPAPKLEQHPAPRVEQRSAPKVEQRPAPRVEQRPAAKAEQRPAPKVEQRPAEGQVRRDGHKN